MNRLVDHLRANVVAYLALFVALGGSSYAAFSLPAGSVGTNQLRNHSITPIKLNSGRIGAYVRAWAVIQGGTRVVAARPRARIVDWDPSSASGDIAWQSAVSGKCFAQSSGAGDVVESIVRIHFRRLPAVVHFGISAGAGQPDASSATVAVVTVLCPQ